jgi:hypothetical protein
VPELFGHGVGEEQLTRRDGLHPHIDGLARPHHLVVLHIVLGNPALRQQPVGGVEEEGVGLDGLPVGRMGGQVDVAGVVRHGMAQVILQLGRAGAGPVLGEAARLNKDDIVGRLNWVGRLAPGAVEAVPVVREAGEVFHRERGMTGEDLLAADAERFGGGWIGDQALDHTDPHRRGNQLRTAEKKVNITENSFKKYRYL